MTGLSVWINWLTVPLWVVVSVFWASAAQSSQYGCKGLAQDKDIPVLEGKKGVFFRIQSDLRMDQRISDQAIEQLGALSQALAEQGTTLVYLPVPTKSLGMPQMLPDQARLYGYEPALAAQVFQNLVSRLEGAGVVTVNALPQMTRLPADTPPFFGADFHWTGFGARAAAQAVALRLSQDPRYLALQTSTFVSQAVGPETAFSGLRRHLQLFCHKALPQVVTTRFETRKSDEDSASLDLFDTAGDAKIVLVGTSFSDSEINNFDGFLSEMTGLDVVNRALTGGNQFGAIQDYLTSRAFQDSRPDILLWENPVYNSLTRFADQPLRELTAAARGNCRVFLSSDAHLPEGVTLPQTTSDDSILVDLGRSPLRRVAFRFTMTTGEVHSRFVQRSARQSPTGRFFMPITGLGRAAPKSLRIDTFDADLAEARVFLCPAKKGDGQ